MFRLKTDIFYINKAAAPQLPSNEDAAVASPAQRRFFILTQDITEGASSVKGAAENFSRTSCLQKELQRFFRFCCDFH